ncbi:hypothetical protein GCM10020331_017160 [Ectobacillus funiculus]
MHLLFGGGPMLGKMLNHFFSEVEWGELDYLVLDLPPGTGDVALDVHSMLPSCKEIIVTTPHPTAAFVAARAGAMALRTEHEIVGVIENMSYFESKVTGEKEYVFGQGGGKKSLLRIYKRFYLVKFRFSSLIGMSLILHHLYMMKLIKSGKSIMRLLKQLSRQLKLNRNNLFL